MGLSAKVKITVSNPAYDSQNPQPGVFSTITIENYFNYDPLFKHMRTETFTIDVPGIGVKTIQGTIVDKKYDVDMSGNGFPDTVATYTVSTSGFEYL
mgnify:CR=1 FL=1